MNGKCAPKYAGDTSSCFSRDALLDIVNAYNRSHNDQITLQGKSNKITIWRTIQRRLQKNCGSDETCWLQQSFLSNQKKLDQYFKPVAPLGQYQWLTTEDIYKVMSQWSETHPHFRFVGPLPIDFMSLNDSDSRYLQRLNLQRDPNELIGVIFNMDPHYKSGSHWIALAIDRKRREINFFDSYGDRFPVENKYGLPFYDSQGRFYGDTNVMSMPIGIQEFVYQLFDKSGVQVAGGQSLTNHPRSAYRIKVNDVQHQYANSECGIYSMLFLVKTLFGESFEQIANDIVLDEQANQLRDFFFRRNH